VLAAQAPCFLEEEIRVHRVSPKHTKHDTVCNSNRLPGFGFCDFYTAYTHIILGSLFCRPLLPAAALIQSSLGKYLKEEGWPGAAVQSQADLENYVRTTACSGNALTGGVRGSVETLQCRPALPA